MGSKAWQALPSNKGFGSLESTTFHIGCVKRKINTHQQNHKGT
jgi:hypothetical protein